MHIDSQWAPNVNAFFTTLWLSQGKGAQQTSVPFADKWADGTYTPHTVEILRFYLSKHQKSWDTYGEPLRTITR